MLNSKASLFAAIPDHKSVNRYIARHDGLICCVFGMTEDAVLVHSCYYRDDGFWLRPMGRIKYSEVSHVVDFDDIVNKDGEAVEKVKA